jgi:hypothetical protein
MTKNRGPRLHCKSLVFLMLLRIRSPSSSFQGTLGAKVEMAFHTRRANETRMCHFLADYVLME